MQAHHFLLLIFIFITMIGCSAQPVVYSEGQENEAQMRRDLAYCQQLAARRVPEGRRVARNAGKAAVMGGVIGGIQGIAYGQAPKRMLAGAAVMGGLGATQTAMNPNQVQRRYVETCLRRRGHQIMGWN